MFDPEIVALVLGIVFGASGIGTGIRAYRNPQEQRAEYVLMAILLVATAAGSVYMSQTMGEWRTLYPQNDTLPLAISGGVAIVGVLVAAMRFIKKHRFSGTYMIAGILAAVYVNTTAEARTHLAPVPNQVECKWVPDATCAAWNQSMADALMGQATFCYYAAIAVVAFATLFIAASHLRRASKTIDEIMGSSLVR